MCRPSCLDDGSGALQLWHMRSVCGGARDLGACAAGCVHLQIVLDFCASSVGDGAVL